MLDAHNVYRAKHCVPPLTWSAELAQSAQRWATRCVFAHEERIGPGENLFRGTAGAFTPGSAAQHWYAEIAAFNFWVPDFSAQTGHFSQMIWRGSERLGCAVALCRGMEFWVCRYAPAGNVVGEFAQNVPRPCR